MRFAAPVGTSIEGRWQMIRAELGGEPAPELVTAHTVVTLADGAYEVRYGREIADRGTFELGATGSILTLRGKEGPNAARVIPCIFQLMGDRLRVCYGLDGVLPGAFRTLPGESRYLAVYRRVPPEA